MRYGDGSWRFAAFFGKATDVLTTSLTCLMKVCMASSACIVHRLAFYLCCMLMPASMGELDF
ncbi:hypothetical protein Goshw_013786, partial [Gossypium schwendimanii]|nr:hypothetical protein [Gossypium schwendimanii]